jgi:hypothetical protein
MATRGNTTFQKKQKEMARKDKQKRKAERRAERKLNRNDSDNSLSGADEGGSSEVESTAEVEDVPNPISGTNG